MVVNEGACPVRAPAQQPWGFAIPVLQPVPLSVTAHTHTLKSLAVHCCQVLIQKCLLMCRVYTSLSTHDMFLLCDSTVYITGELCITGQHMGRHAIMEPVSKVMLAHDMTWSQGMHESAVVTLQPPEGCP